jgi:O-antigen/teichoic acid export membrane protein
LLLIVYAGVRLLGHPVLGAMSKRFYSDGQLSLSFGLGAVDQILLLAPAALVALSGGTFAEAIAWATLLRGLQALAQAALVQQCFPWQGPMGVTSWTVPRLWRRMLLLAPASLPAPLIQNGITLVTAALLGQPQLAVFSTHRTAAGFLGQFGNALIEPRVPVMLRQNEPQAAAWGLVGRTLPLVAAAIPLLLLVFPLLYPLWLGASWRPQIGLFVVLLLVQLLRVLQQPFAVLIRSRNEPLSALAEGWLPLLIIYGLLLTVHPSHLLPFALILMFAEALQWPLRLLLLAVQRVPV